MKYSAIPLAQTITQHCQAKGISNIVISPGSRNAPLIISFTENPYFNCYSIVDERCAAFFALGLAQYSGKPAAVVCTSGSALLNYYPAVAEAFYSEIPLIVISADRPSYKIDVGDGQTIRQDNVFDRHIGYSANLKQDLTHATDRIKRYRPEWIDQLSVENEQNKVQAYNDNELNKAINISIHEYTPVHINAPFEEPLYEVLKESTLQPNLDFYENSEAASSVDDEIISAWQKAKRKMVLVGVNPPNTIAQEYLDCIGDDPSVIVLTENTSNIHHQNFFSSIDTLIAPIEIAKDKEVLFQELQPDILLTFGGLIVSKKIKAFLRSFGPERHYHVGQKKANDTFFCLTRHLKMPAQDFLSNIYTKKKETVHSDYYAKWNRVRTKYLRKRESYLTQIQFSDFLAFYIITQRIPDNLQLQLANSSTVRYAQLFDLDKTIKVYCNRGTSGIDGSTSTAIGASLNAESPTLLITGDLSFFYDSNALWNNYMRKDFRIILINNGGGGIFRILPGKDDSENFERFFETKHQLDAKALCAMYGLDYSAVNEKKSLEKKLATFFEPSSKSQLLEVFTPRLKNNKILVDYFHFIS